MTLGEQVYDLVYQMINETVYSSAAGPNVNNYAKIIYQDPGLISAIDTEFEKAGVVGVAESVAEATGGSGEFENALAEMVDNDWMGAAEDQMSDKEYASWMESETKKTPKMGLNIEENSASLISAGLSGAKNPVGLGMSAVAMIPHAALVMLAIAITPLIIDQLKSPGSMLDIRWRRIMELEFNALMSRQDQWNAQIGVRQVYVASHDQFLIGNGAALSESNLRRVRESDQRIADRLEFTDHALELFR